MSAFHLFRNSFPVIQTGWKREYATNTFRIAFGVCMCVSACVCVCGGGGVQQITKTAKSRRNWGTGRSMEQRKQIVFCLFDRPVVCCVRFLKCRGVGHEPRLVHHHYNCNIRYGLFNLRRLQPVPSKSIFYTSPGLQKNQFSRLRHACGITDRVKTIKHKKIPDTASLVFLIQNFSHLYQISS